MRLKEGKFSKEEKKDLDMVVKRYLRIRRKNRLNRVKKLLFISKGKYKKI